MKYQNIKNIESHAEIVPCVSKRKLNVFAAALVFILSLSVLNIGIANSNLSAFVHRVIMYWSPKEEDIGKIKFVNFSFNSSKDNGVFIVESPFKNYVAKNKTPKILEVSGLGDSVVLSPINGRVKAVDFVAQKYNIVIESGNVLVNLTKIDYTCVSVGQNVSVGQKIAISNDSLIEFSIICDEKFIDLPAGDASDTFFE